MRAIGVFVLILALASAFAWAATLALVVDLPLQHADALFVFSGGPVYRERVVYAAQLFHEGRAREVLLADDGVRGPWSRTLQRNPLSVERGVLWMTDAGVPVTKIHVLPGRVSSTYEEAVALKAYARRHALTSVLAVTSRHHTRRAFWTLRRIVGKTGIRIGIAAAPADPGADADAQWRRAIRAWSMVASEYVKLAYYRLRYS